MKPKIDDLVTASHRRERGRRSEQRGTASLGWYRGEQSARLEVAKLLKRWGFTRISQRVLDHYSMDSEGTITLFDSGKRKRKGKR